MYICVCFARRILYSAVLNLSTGCFAVYAKRITRAQRFCFVMCPLDMKGVVGAATVVGSLQHGSGICEQRADADPLEVALRASSLSLSQQDENFLCHFRASAAVTNGLYPPAALVEIYHEPDDAFAKLRRLHLIIVELRLLISVSIGT